MGRIIYRGNTSVAENEAKAERMKRRKKQKLKADKANS